MAGRPAKQGIDYFPIDVGFFTDVKVRKISRACGASSTSILICLLCNIYKDDGYYILWDEDLPFVIADTVGVSEGAVKEVLLKALQVEFFSREMYDKYNILTSNGIQKRFFLATYQRKETSIIKDYLINCANNPIDCTNNSINHADNEQSKVKVNRKNIKPKENSTNVEQKKAGQAKKLAAAKAATLSRKKDFGKNLVPYMEKYGKEMIRAFFDYWSEMNKSETKMRFEKQPTWEVAKRLATWANKEKFNGRNKNADTSFSGPFNTTNEEDGTNADSAGIKELINVVRIG
ncbi:MAG: hypothetical protein H6Q13_3594 [Bacteroidetes bacterium]|nr:hypothetical protein [Bacteroidota bacterium]